MTTHGAGEHPPGWCLHHEVTHGLMQWSGLCQSPDDAGPHMQTTLRWRKFQEIWDAAQEADQARKRRPWRWPKVALVCWWKHGTRKVPGGWLSNYCWACTGIARRR